MSAIELAISIAEAEAPRTAEDARVELSAMAAQVTLTPDELERLLPVIIQHSHAVLERGQKVDPVVAGVALKIAQALEAK